jgi:hypothetical protein
MILDLQKDAQKIREFFLERVKTFVPAKNDGPGKKGKPIQAVYAGYETSQAGWLALIFDTRPDASHDGEWTCHLEKAGNMFEFPHWTESLRDVSEEPLDLVQHDGEKVKIHAATKDAESPATVVTAIGKTIQAVLEESRASGVFDSLPLQDDCWLGIEEFDGGFGWSSDEAEAVSEA